MFVWVGVTLATASMAIGPLMLNVAAAPSAISETVNAGFPSRPGPNAQDTPVSPDFASALAAHSQRHVPTSDVWAATYAEQNVSGRGNNRSSRSQHQPSDSSLSPPNAL